MSLTLHLDDLIKNLKTFHPNDTDFSPFIDLTLLNKQANRIELLALYDQAIKYNPAAICVYPEHLTHFKDLNTVKLATVVNFPHGNQALESVYQEIDFAIEHAVEEIDYVFSYQEYLKGNRKAAIYSCNKIAEYCYQRKLTLKIILESGAFPSTESIYQASMDILESHCQFLKTSTGKIQQGATLHAAFAILCAIKDSNKDCGIKLSGGMRTQEVIQDYFNLIAYVSDKPIDSSWVRVGTSQLPKVC